MKKIVFCAILGLGGIGFSSVVFHSCTAVASSPIGVAIIKQLLLGGIDNVSRTYSNKQAFLNNDFVVKALPESLQSVYNLLNKVSPSTALKVKENIAEVASETVVFSAPILRSAVHELNGQDVSRILNGGEGVATQILREKSEHKLLSVLEPKVDNKLKELGVNRLVSNILQGSNVLNSLLGGQNVSISQTDFSRFVTRQLVDGMFYLMANYENQQKSNVMKNIQ